ncbi:unnamed protein product [Prorocentrum cordatum]|uniref:Uncharacterized protein n=1 Tax=Prorocentrum cordatum TaxID=2364126 RepID=A0ABN9UT26_9DINO|nr:unnamed protein product [Polarella glacialis]
MALAKLCLAALAGRVAYSLSVAIAEPDELEGAAAPDAPEWCKSSEELTVEQRKDTEQATAEAKAAWAKKEVASLVAKGEPVPSWLADTVTKDDERQNATNWAVRQAMLLKEADLEVPDWLKEKVQETLRRGPTVGPRARPRS